MDSKVVRWGPIGICLVGLEALHTLSCLIAGSFLDQGVLGPHPETSLRTPLNTTSKPTLSHNTTHTTSNLTSEERGKKKKGKGYNLVSLSKSKQRKKWRWIVLPWRDQREGYHPTEGLEESSESKGQGYTL